MTFDAFMERFEKRSKTAKGWSVKCPAHEDKSPSLSVSRGRDGRILLKCFAGCTTEAVCAAMGLKVSDLFEDDGEERFETASVKFTASVGGNGAVFEIKDTSAPRTIETVYSYTDAIGRELYQALRYTPKGFSQRQPDGSGGWLKTMDGVEKVLYHLPAVKAADVVWIVEGEKDADNLTALGFAATTSVGGANSWLDGYAESLIGKDVVICGDNDEPGLKYVEKVFDSLPTKAKSVRIVKVPAPHKDVSDYIEAFTDKEVAGKELAHMAEVAVPHVGGVRMPLYSMADIEPRYARQVRESSKTMLDLSAWLPSLRRVRPLIPGELALFIGNTGTGKTAILQNLALNARHLRTVMFEMELPEELLFERFIALEFKQTCKEVAENYKTKAGEAGTDVLKWKFGNLFICPEPRLSLDTIEGIICRAELKMGGKPVLVLIDYVQLMQARGSRYEKTSELAEGLKVLAKATKTIVVVASQIARPSLDSPKISLHSAKDSGSLENSAGLVIGAWRDEDDDTAMHMKVLKATKGGGGTEVVCNFDGARMSITERAEKSEEMFRI